MKAWLIFLTITAAHPAGAQTALCETSSQSAVADVPLAATCAATQSLSDQAKGEILEGATRGCASAFAGGAWAAATSAYTLLRDQAAHSYHEYAKGWSKVLGRIRARHSDPVVLAQETARASVQEQAPSLQDFSRALAEAPTFFRATAKGISNQWGLFWCLPASKIKEVVCEQSGLIAVSLLTHNRKSLLAAGDKLVRTTKGAAELLIAAAKKSSVDDVRTVAEKTAQARLVLAAQEHRTIGRLGEASINEYRDASGTPYLKLDELVKGTDGKIKLNSREIPADALTGGINANSEVGLTILNKGIAPSSKGVGKAYVQVDFNHLGQVNYFKGQSAAGDAYIRRTGQIVRASTREGDLFFRTGGDEVGLIVNSDKPEIVKAMLERINSEVRKDPELRQLFRAEIARKTEAYRAIAKSDTFDQLPAKFRENLSDDALTKARDDFPGFKKEILDTQLTVIKYQARYHPTISMGATMVGEGESFAAVKARAEAQEIEAKIDYKRRAGFPLGKYQIFGEGVTDTPDLMAFPGVRDPIPAP